MTRPQPARAAEPVLRRSRALFETAFSPDPWRSGEAQSVLGSCLAALGQLGEARRFAVAGHATLAEKRGAERTTAYLTAPSLPATLRRTPDWPMW